MKNETARTKIQRGDRVKWTSQGRMRVGFVVGIVPRTSNRNRRIDLHVNTAIGLADFSHNLDRHKLAFKAYYWPSSYAYILARKQVSYLVSVRVSKRYASAKRQLYWPRKVELCEDGDERDGVYRVGIEEQKDDDKR